MNRVQLRAEPYISTTPALYRHASPLLVCCLSKCWCGDSDTDYDKHGEGVCNYPCTGDANEICGGKNAISVYEGSAGNLAARLTSPPTPPASTEYAGCFADKKRARIMTLLLTADDITAEV